MGFIGVPAMDKFLRRLVTVSGKAGVWSLGSEHDSQVWKGVVITNVGI